MTTKIVKTTKPYAEFVGYQKDERVGGVRAWYIIKAPGNPRHLSTVFAPTLVELGISIPKTLPYFPDSKFDSVWIFRCENKSCHISYLTKEIVIQHVKKTKHTQIIQELVTTTPVDKELGLTNKKHEKAIILDQEDTQELDEFGVPIEKKKKKHKIVFIGTGNKKERFGFDDIKDGLNYTKTVNTVATVVASKVVDYSEQKPVIERGTDKAEDAALAFRKKIRAQNPHIDWKG